MSTALVLVRACHFWSVAILIGGSGLLLGHEARHGLRLLRAATAVAALSGLAWLALTIVGITGDAASLIRLEDWQAFFAQAPFGPAWALRLGLLAGCAAILPIARPAPFLAIGIALAIDQAWLGHAAAGVGSLGDILLLAYWVHVVSGLGWVGALTMLVAMIIKRDEAAIAIALPRFSTIGVALVAAIFASGLVNAVAHLTGVADLVGDPYGRLVATKLGLFLGMVGLALNNRQASRRGGFLRRGLALSASLEAALGVLIVGVAAALGTTAPP